jgi:DNA-binding transcriptional MerR regulator
MGNSARRDIRSADLAEKQNRALALRRQGMSLVAIGQVMGCHHTHAMRMIRAAIKDITRENAEEVRDLELERLDQKERRLQKLWRAAIPAAQAGDPEAIKVAAKLIETGLRVSESRRKLLGADAPAKSEVTLTGDATPAAARRVMQELFGGNVGPVGPEVDAGVSPPGTATH